jgi:hypothetical protein
MQLAQLSSAALLLALIPFATYQTQAGQTPAAPPAGGAPKQDKPERAKVVKSAPEEEADRVRASFLGVWQLVRFDMDGETLSGPSCRGYMLVTDEFLSLDMQVVTKYVRNLDTQGQLFSSGVQRWQYEQSRLVLTTTSLIGVGNFTPEEMVTFERSGTPREYRVNFADDTLTLERNASSRMLFRRISKPVPPPETAVEPPAKRDTGKK